MENTLEIVYTYEVTSIDNQNKTITVVYESDGRESRFVTIPHPYKGVDLDIYLQQNSPVDEWVNEHRELAPILVGAKNTVHAVYHDI